MWCVTTGVATRARLCDHPFRMPRRIRPLLIVVFLLAASCMLVACRKEDTQESVSPAGTVAFGRYSSDGSSFTVVLTGVHPSGRCVTSVAYQWDAPATSWEEGKETGLGVDTTTNPPCSNPTSIAASATMTVTVPTRSGGGTLHFRFKKYLHNETSYVAWTTVEIPAYTGPVAPTVRVFAHASPAGDERTLLDARLSTGSGALTYVWSPSECVGSSYLGGDAVPAGTSLVAYRYTGECTVTVTDANGGASASATVPVSTGLGLHNGSFTFDGTSTVTIHGVYGTSGNATRACVDLTGSGVYNHEVVLSGFGGSITGNVALTALTPGIHVIGATLWTTGIPTGSTPDNPGCTNTGTSGAVQVIKDLYTVDSAGSASAARRGVRSSSFVAPSSMRFVSTKTLSEGTFNPETGVISGATMVGSFSWTTPKSSKGVKRPSGAAQLTKGTFVMRAINEMQGPSVGKASIMLGTGTMLLRGTDGTLACGTLAGSFNSSAITLAGGTGRARTLAGVLTSERVTYVWPTPASVAARSGGVAGVLATALGWITGDQPTERAKKPSKKPKWPKVRPVKGSGTASLQTAAKAAGLPASCKALVQYLPQ